MKLNTIGIWVIAGGALAITGCATGGLFGAKEADESKEAMALLAQARVTIDQALRVATDKQAGRVIEAELEKKHGKAIWEVEIVTAEGKVVEVHVDAETGAVIDVEEKKPD